MIKKTITAAVALLAATALVAPAANAADSTIEATGKKGVFGWGVKESFRGYIEGPIAGGGIEVSPPAKRLDDGTFTWGKGRGQVDVSADTANLKFKGQVYFYGHDEGTGPQLEVYLENPRLVIDGADSVLVADVTSRGFSGEGLVEYPNVELATVDTNGLDLVANAKGVVKVTGLTTALTAEGAVAFAGFYAEGTAFDPLSFKIKIV